MHINSLFKNVKPKHFLELLIGDFNDQSLRNQAEKTSSTISSFSFLKVEWYLQGN